MAVTGQTSWPPPCTELAACGQFFMAANTVCRWWTAIEVLIVAGATTAPARSRPTTPTSNRSNALIAATAARQLHISYSHEKCHPDGGMTLIR
jgi:hypothetical protein